MGTPGTTFTRPRAVAGPYDDLLSTNARRGGQDVEYELRATGAFDDDRYFDVTPASVRRPVAGRAQRRA
jgi:hypothetical protein